MSVLICDVCAESFENRSSVNRHFRTHSTERPLQCRFCSMRTKHSNNLSTHEKEHCRFRRASLEGFGLKKNAQPCQCQKCQTCQRRQLRSNDGENRNCDSCDKCFSSLLGLIEHVRKWHLGEQFQCDECGKFFGFYSGLRHHTIDIHLASAAAAAAPSLNCDDCEMPFSGIKYLLAHIKNIRFRPKSKCAVCQKNYGSYYLKDHVCTNERRAALFECDVCGRKFRNRNGCTIHATVGHVTTQIDINSKPRADVRNATKIEGQRVLLQCSKCVKWFATRRQLWKHERRHAQHETSAAAAECQRCRICDKRFSSKELLGDHLRGGHNDRPRLACLQCERNFSRSGNLKRHIRTRHGGPKITYQCDICHKLIHDKAMFAAHAQLNHISDKDISATKNGTSVEIVNGRALFQCSKCVHRFTTIQVLRTHEQQLHRKNKTLFSCQLCDWTGNAKSSLFAHERNKHKKRNECFVCFDCEQTYASFGGLKMHLFWHGAPTLSYQCDLCDKVFNRLRSFIRHIYGKLCRGP